MYSSLLVLLISVLVLLDCTHIPLAGGSTDTELGSQVSGMVYNEDGSNAKKTMVELLPSDYNPFYKDSLHYNPRVLTDDTGFYSFENIPLGEYTIQAVHLDDRSRTLKTGIIVNDSSTTFLNDTLHLTGAISVELPDEGEFTTGYVYIQGTSFVASTVNNNRYVTLDSVPPGMIPAIVYGIKNGSVQIPIRYRVRVNSENTTIVTNPSWHYAQHFILNTTESGADISSTIMNFPVLIRLNRGNFNFSEALSRGEDIRFMNTYNKSLPYEIENWDSVNQTALIWVKVDSIIGNNSTQSVIMYWGNEAAGVQSNGNEVFDTAAGFQGVWHLDEKGDEQASDATSNQFGGTAFNMANIGSVPGAIGNARVFDGETSYIRMKNTSSGNLNFSENSAFTLSAWVYADTLDDVYRAILSKGFEQCFMWLTYFPSAEPKWEFSVFSSLDNWHMSNVQAQQKQWVLLSGVRQGTSQYLFCNGEQVAATSAVYPQNVSRDTSNDLTVGRFLKEATYPSNFGYCFFKGKIDEVRISSEARSADWIKLSYMNQRNDDRLVMPK